MEFKSRTTNILTLVVLAMLLIPTAGFAQGVLFVKNGKVGIGLDTPATDLEIQENSGTSGAKFMFQLRSATGDPKARYIGVNGTWSLSPQGQSFVINKQGEPMPANELRLDSNGNLFILGVLDSGSSRTYKQDIVPVAVEQVLNRVLELPINEWSYTKDPEVRHVGPIAEDFSEAFGLGSSNKSISTYDVAGIAIAAIQGLNDRLDAKNGEIENLRARLAALESQLQHR